MRVDFTKMQGAGNDFVVLDGRARPWEPAAPMRARIADRRLGVGCDQVILLLPPQQPGFDAVVRFFNGDGSEAGACGNGTRCVAMLILAANGAERVRLQGVAGPLEAVLLASGQVQVDMGPARLDWREVPLCRPADTLHLGIDGDPAACGLGNPHATLFVEDLDRVELARQGAALERHALFPERANIGFVQLRGPSRIRLAVWERAAGLTPACGSGACAAVVNAHRRGLTGRACAVEMPGGVLHVEWRLDGHVLLAGPAAAVFTGSIRLEP